MTERLKARQRRVRVIRRRVVAIATAIFLALWAVIFVQLLSGNDPALARSGATKKVAALSAARRSSSSGATTGSSGGAGSGKASGSSSSSASATPVTTRQS